MHLLPTMEAIDKIRRELPAENLIQLLDAEAMNAESQLLHPAIED